MASEEATSRLYELDPDESVIDDVIEAVSAVANHEPASLNPLYSIVDPAALDALFRPGRPGDPHVEFQCNGRDVRVTSDRNVEIRTTVNEE